MFSKNEHYKILHLSILLFVFFSCSSSTNNSELTDKDDNKQEKCGKFDFVKKQCIQNSMLDTNNYYLAYSIAGQIKDVKKIHRLEEKIIYHFDKDAINIEYPETKSFDLKNGQYWVDSITNKIYFMNLCHRDVLIWVLLDEFLTPKFSIRLVNEGNNCFVIYRGAKYLTYGKQIEEELFETKKITINTNDIYNNKIIISAFKELEKSKKIGKTSMPELVSKDTTLQFWVTNSFCYHCYQKIGTEKIIKY